jgi:NADPH-dependent curcumin reductase
MERFVGEKEVTFKEDVTEGLNHAIGAFVGMLEGKNFGKAVIKVAD